MLDGKVRWVAGLKEYFDNLKDDGSLDSSGVFTLDPKKVEWKLAQYQLASSGLYPLFLLKAACAAGATVFGVRFDRALLSNKVQIEFRITGFSVSEVELQEATLGQSGTREEVRFLVVALTAARALGQVEVVSQGLHLKVKDQKPTFLAPSESFEGTRFSLSGRSLDDPNKILRERGRWSPIPLSCIEKKGRRAILPSDCPSKTLTVFVGPEYSSEMMSSCPWGCFVSTSSKVILLAWADHAKTRCLGIHRGVSYEIDLGLPQAFGLVIPCDDLELDLSYSSFIQNEAFEKKKKLAWRFVSALVEMVVSSELEWNEDDADEITMQIKACWREGAGTEGLRHFYETAITEHFPLQPIGSEAMLNRLSQFEKVHQVELFLQMYRHEVIDTRAYYVPTASRWISEEIEFRQAVGRDWKEADTVRRLIQNLFFRKKVSWNKWEIHPFFSLLESYLGRVKISHRGVDKLEGVHPSWLMPLKLHYDLSAVGGYAPFRLLHLLEEGRIPEAMVLVAECQAASFVPFRHAWNHLMLDFYQKKISWLQYVKIRARASFADETEQRVLGRARRMEPSRPEEFEDWAIHHGVFDHGFWLLAVYYTCFCWKHGIPSHRFWCKVLLQASIGYPGEDGGLEENLSRPLKLPLLSSNRS
jgi:hypothetical protein